MFLPFVRSFGAAVFSSAPLGRAFFPLPGCALRRCCSPLRYDTSAVVCVVFSVFLPQKYVLSPRICKNPSDLILSGDAGLVPPPDGRTCRVGGTVRRISLSCLFGNSWCCRFRFRRCILVRSNVLPPREEGLLRIGRIFYRHFGSFSAGGVLLRVRWAFVSHAAGRSVVRGRIRNDAPS